MMKRDTIIIAAIINIGLLAVLFMIAMRKDDEPRISEQIEQPVGVPMAMDLNPTPSVPVAIAPISTTPRDEVDDVLNSYTALNANAPAITSEPPQFSMAQEEIKLVPSDPTPVVVENRVESSHSETVSAPSYNEVTVKKGDFLEKIAKANGTTVSEIKKINNLASERINIGQVLKVPSKKGGTNVASNNSTKKQAAASNSVYHTIKSGDNPWKIARQYKVNYEDILTLNNLNEEKARNLKVGEKIRVK